MIKILFNIINFFISSIKLKKLKLNFFSDGEIKNINDVKNLDLKKDLVNELISFNKNCNFFYENVNVIDCLKIGGLWKDYLLKNKKKLFETYQSSNPEKIILLHENMFFNSLLRGLWSYSHFDQIKKNYTGISLFLKDLHLYKIMFRDYKNLPSSDSLNKWGYSNGKQKIQFLDLSSDFQKNLIIDSLNLLKKKNKFNILEIGGGFGSLAERLFDSNNLNSITLVDLPATLCIAYYYLCSKYGKDTVELINSANDLQHKIDLDKKKIYLVPSAFYGELKKYDDYDLLCNFASFSEMDYETVKFYLENLPSKLQIIVSSNSNQETQLDRYSHTEVIIDNFPLQKEFNVVFSAVQTPFFYHQRYKTKIWFKNN